jgi:hypothetical protein
MQIELTKSGKRVSLNDRVAIHLIKAGVARAVMETRLVQAEELEAEKPKRQYRRRDMKAE